MNSFLRKPIEKMLVPKKSFKGFSPVFIVIALIFSIAMIHYSRPNFFQNVYKIIISSTTVPKRNITLLAWTSFFGLPYFPINGKLDCPNYTCFFTINRSEVDKSDAIIFHWADVKIQDLPTTDRNSSKWVLFNYEPPCNTHWPKVEPMISQVHLVVSYRSDSDIVDTYGYVRRRQVPDPAETKPNHETLTDFQTKKEVAWVVSHCGTAGKREDYVKILRKYLNVYIYGGCGSVSRCKNIPRIECYKGLSKLFKFYLAFENSICADYVTEKAFYPLMTGMVPVVFGGANYSRILPPNSFINALEFTKPEDLASHLYKVGSNFTLYKRYHEWRKDFVVTEGLSSVKWMCHLCKLIHENRVSDSTKNEKSFYRWWYQDAKCNKFSSTRH